MQRAKATTIWIVEQLGLAIILSSLVNSEALISGTINFLSVCIRQADELSITVIPALANSGAHFNEISPPAEKMAISGFNEIACSIPTTSISALLYLTFFPIDFSEATGITVSHGNFLSSNTLSITLPTKPVAPTTAIFIVLNFKIKIHQLIF